jgi:signal transduction histidine kinase
MIMHNRVRGRSINIHPPTENVTRDLRVLSDERMMEQVLYNIYSNAVKYSHDYTNIYTDVEVKNGLCYISVTNYGLHMNSITTDQVFQRGTRGDNAMKINSEGAGVGGYIANKC